MAIHIFQGRPGEGKTYTLTRKVHEALDLGIDVYSNIDITPVSWFGLYGKRKWRGNFYRWDCIGALKGIENGIIVMDEVQAYFNSRKWKSIDEDQIKKLQQHRKDGLHIWGTVQHFARIDKAMRELANYYHNCNKVLGNQFTHWNPTKAIGKSLGRPWGLVRVETFEPRDLIRAEQMPEVFDQIEPLGKFWVPIRKKFAYSYDTTQSVARDEDENEVCPHCGERHKKNNRLVHGSKNENQMLSTIDY